MADKTMLAKYKMAAKGLGKQPKPGRCWMCLKNHIQDYRKHDAEIGLCEYCADNRIWGPTVAKSCYYLRDEHLEALSAQYALEGLAKLPPKHWFREDIIEMCKKVYTPEELRLEEVKRQQRHQQLVAEETARRQQLDAIVKELSPYPIRYRHNFRHLYTYISSGYNRTLATRAAITDEASLREYVKWVIYKSKRIEARTLKLEAACRKCYTSFLIRIPLYRAYVMNGLGAAQKLDKKVVDFETLVKRVRRAFRKRLFSGTHKKLKIG
jgi:hypothetical protein